jgi:hypothetical protein
VYRDEVERKNEKKKGKNERRTQAIRRSKEKEGMAAVAPNRTMELFPAARPESRCGLKIPRHLQKV